MIIKLSFRAIALSLFCASATAGPVVQIGPSLYEINTVSGLLSDHRATIESQVWYGDSILAEALSNEVGESLMAPFNLGAGPMFAFNVRQSPGADYTTGFVYRFNRAQEQNATAGVYYTYATGRFVGAAIVPEPPHLPLLALIALALFTRRPGRVAAPRAIRS